MKKLSPALLLAAILAALPHTVAAAAPPAAPPAFEQVKSEPNPEKRARLAVDFAVLAERNAETAYSAADLDAVNGHVKAATEAMELAASSFEASHKTPGRSPGPYKYAEQRSREILKRMNDLQRTMDADERGMVDPAIARIQAIHDAWFEGLMGRGK